MWIISTLLTVYDPRPGAPSRTARCWNLWWHLHFLNLTVPTRSDTKDLYCQVSGVIAELVDGVIMNKKWQIHEKCNRVHFEILYFACMSSAISSAFSHGWGQRLDSWHFFCALSKCCGASTAVSTSRQHLCLCLTAALSPSGTRDVCGSFVMSDISWCSCLWHFTEFRLNRLKSVTLMKHVHRRESELWTSLHALMFTRFCSSSWYNLRNLISLFHPFEEFLPFCAF